MNAGNKQREQADGFMIEALHYTNSIKDNNGESLLLFIVNKIRNEKRDIMDFHKRVSVCRNAIKCDMSQVKDEVAEVK